MAPIKKKWVNSKQSNKSVLEENAPARLKLLKITAVVLLLLPASHTAKLQRNCALHSLGDTSMHFKHGDIILAGIFQFTYATISGFEELKPPKDQICNIPSVTYLRHYLAFYFAIEEINKTPNILPNITLGYDIYDTCYYNEQAMQATMRALSGGVKHHWNYRCGNNGKIIAFIGHLLSSPSQSISQMLNLYGYPQIQYHIDSRQNPLHVLTAVSLDIGNL